MKSLWSQDRDQEKNYTPPREEAPARNPRRLTTMQIIYIGFGLVLLMPIVGTILYRKGNRVFGGILIGIFLLIFSINAINWLEIGAKK